MFRDYRADRNAGVSPRPDQAATFAERQQILDLIWFFCCERER
jgi:hypothetical protein